MFGLGRSGGSNYRKVEKIKPAVVMPYAPVIVRQENIAAIKTLLANLTPEAIGTFTRQQRSFSYSAVGGDYPFGTNREPPVFCQFWEYEGMKPCCRVLCLEGHNGGFTLITKAETRLLTLFPGDKTKGIGPAALLSVPTAQGGVAISATGDNKAFRGAIYLSETDATNLMTGWHTEALQVARHLKGHGPSCPSCPTGNEAKAIAAAYG